LEKIISPLVPTPEFESFAKGAPTAQALAEAGIDAIEVSCTCSGEHAQPAAQGIDRPEKEAYFAAQAGAIKQAVDLPIILWGGCVRGA